MFKLWLLLLAIDEIYLVEEWRKRFCPLYAKIAKIRTQIVNNVLLLRVLVILTKKIRVKILDKAGFNKDYWLIQTSFDWPEIMQIHQFMEHLKANCLDLQFLLSPIAKETKDIQKTVIFVNSVAEICSIIAIIRS